MAASKDFQDKISTLLECSICLDRLYDPKALQCTHSYCKTCLDSMLQFRDDGSAFIECPLRCSDYTEVGIKQTTKDLKTPVQFKNLVDMLSEEVAECGISQVIKTCICGAAGAAAVLYFCPNCNVILCSTCQPKHNHCHHGNDVMEYIPIKYDKINDDITPWCTKHEAFADYVWQGEFICVYCKERLPEKRCSQEIESVHSKIKTWVNNKMVESRNFEDVLQNAIVVTEGEIANIRNSLTTTLRKRKIKCLSEYLRKLNEDEEKLIKEFDFVTSNHVKEYLLTTPADYVNVKPPFQIIHNKKNIYKNVRQLKKREITLPSVKVSLTEVNYGIVDPLGNIISETNQEGYLLRLRSEQVTSCVSNAIPKEDIGDTTTPLIKQLEVLLQQALTITPGNPQASSNEESEYSSSDSDSNSDSNSDSEDEEEELRQALFQVAKVGLKSISQLCREKKEEVVIEMLKTRKNILDIKDVHGVTILHRAAECGCLQLMRFILNKKYIDIDKKDAWKRTPLNYAVKHDQVKAVELLIDYNCKL